MYNFLDVDSVQEIRKNKELLKRLLKLTYKELKDDDDFKQVYKKYNSHFKKHDYKNSIKQLLNYCFYDDYYNPFLSDYSYNGDSWMRFYDDTTHNDYIINISDVYDCYKSMFY